MGPRPGSCAGSSVSNPSWRRSPGSRPSAMGSPRARSGTISMPTRIVGLTAFKGIGVLFASVLTGEFYPRDFASRGVGWEAVRASWARPSGAADRAATGVSPGPETPRPAAATIEPAGLWLRHRPQSVLSLWFRERVGTQKRSTRRSTIVAMARKLTIALWRPSKPASSLTAPCSRPDSSAQGDDRIQGACVTGFGHGRKTPQSRRVPSPWSAPP